MRLPPSFIEGKYACALLAVFLSGCSQQPVVDLPTALKGIEKSKFLACSGPPTIEYAEGGQDRMAFVTDLRRGAVIGVTSPGAMAPDACSVNATFQDDRLVNSSFSGNMSLCTVVFGPCLQK